ncbi:MAG TPA: tetratricopeptide repeat protein [Kofleriaceae bacterium]
MLKPSTIVAAAGLATGLALWLAAPAAAQSRRYPPEPVDKDAEKAARSNLWSAAITPERHPYQNLVRAATEALAQRTADQTGEAIKKLDAAIKLLPREPEAYRLRGDAYLERTDWARCAADLAAADANRRRDDDNPRALAELHRKLGLCQARAGKLTDAERTLAETAASGHAAGEVWMRLGEVRIAMGKLDEAIAALGSALETTDGNAQAMIHFLLAEAYDRARRPGDALAEAADGVKLDHQLAVLHNPVIPLLGAGEADYMLGLAAHSADPARPEYALAYFRRFVQEAPDSPWRKRAEDHLRDLRGVDLPDTVTRGGSAQLDLDAVRAAARRAMPQLRACLARFPTVVVELEISRSGPRTPPTDRMRPRFFTPPDGVTVRVAVGELVDRDLDAVDRCLEAQANRLALPPVHEHDVFYKVMFDVVGP